METKINNLYGNFVLVGTPIITTGKTYTEGINSETGYKWQKMSPMIKTSDSNAVPFELMGGYHTKKKAIINSMDKSNNKLEIAWADRNDKSIIDNVADFKKLKTNFTSTDYKDAKVFLSEYDFIQDIKDNLTKDMRVVVTGNFKIEQYVDKQGVKQTNTKYNPTQIRLAKDDETNKAELTLSFVFDKDSWSESEFKKDKKVTISAYHTIYDSLRKESYFAPIQLVLNCEKLDMDNAKHKGMFDYYKKCFTAKRGEYYETQWHCAIVRGSVEKEITMEDLSDDQKIQIDLGLASFEDIKKDMRGKAFGDRINEIRILRPTNKFENEKTKAKEVNMLTAYIEENFVVVEEVVETKGDLFDDGDNNNNSVEEDLDSLFN